MINSTCPYILKNLYFYDIVGAYPNILLKQNYDFGDIDLDNKEQRSIYIGKQQINNKNLSSYLIESTNSLVDFYLAMNNIKDEEIIVTQRDGFILSKQLTNNDEFIEMTLRENIDFIIISIDRKKYMTVSDEKVTVKGIANRYKAIDNIYDKFANLDFYNKNILFNQLNSIKNSFMNSEDIDLFLIPKDNKFGVCTYKGNFLISDKRYVNINEINKKEYFNSFFSPFLKSIFLTYV